MQSPLAISNRARALAAQAEAAEDTARYDEANRAYGEAIACLEEGLRRAPDEVDLRNQLIDLLQSAARLSWLLGDFTQQTRRLDRALALAGGAPQKRIGVLLDLAGGARDLGRHTQALAFADEALRICEHDHLAERSRLLILIAEVHQALGTDAGAQTAAAGQACQAARQEIKAHGESPWRLRRLAQALRLLPGDAGLAENAAVSARAMALARERLTECGDAAASGPARDLVWMTLQYAETLRRTGEWDTALVMAKRAVILCDRALDEAPEQLNFPYMKGLALRTAGGAVAELGDLHGAEAHYRAAAEAFGQVLAKVPTSLDELKERSRTWQALGDLLARQEGRRAEADECHRLALQDREALRRIAAACPI